MILMGFVHNFAKVNSNLECNVGEKTFVIQDISTGYKGEINGICRASLYTSQKHESAQPSIHEKKHYCLIIDYCTTRVKPLCKRKCTPNYYFQT